MSDSLVFSVVGPDRPGLVETLADVVAGHGGNWLESRMAHLGGHFAGMVRVSVSAENASALSKALQGLTQDGITVAVCADSLAAAAEPDAARLMRLELVGADQPGIVRMVTQILASHGCNVEEFTSEVTSAPMTGEPLFNAALTVLFPSNVAPAVVKADLEKIAADLMVEIEMKN